MSPQRVVSEKRFLFKLKRIYLKFQRDKTHKEPTEKISISLHNPSDV